MQYDFLGRPDLITHGNGTTAQPVVDDLAYHGAGENFRLREIHTKKGTKSYYRTSYAYEERGRVGKITDHLRSSGPLSSTNAYTYDGLSRLVKTDWLANGTTSDAYDAAYAFDRWGNLTQKGSLRGAGETPLPRHPLPPDHQLRPPRHRARGRLRHRGGGWRAASSRRAPPPPRPSPKATSSTPFNRLTRGRRPRRNGRLRDRRGPREHHPPLVRLRRAARPHRSHRGHEGFQHPPAVRGGRGPRRRDDQVLLRRAGCVSPDAIATPSTRPRVPGICSPAPPSGASPSRRASRWAWRSCSYCCSCHPGSGATAAGACSWSRPAPSPPAAFFWLALLPPGLAKAALPGNVHPLALPPRSPRYPPTRSPKPRATSTARRAPPPTAKCAAGMTAAATSSPPKWRSATNSPATRARRNPASSTREPATTCPSWVFSTSHDPKRQFPSPYAYGPGDPHQRHRPDGRDLRNPPRHRHHRGRRPSHLHGHQDRRLGARHSAVSASASS